MSSRFPRHHISTAPAEFRGPGCAARQGALLLVICATLSTRAFGVDPLAPLPQAQENARWAHGLNSLGHALYGACRTLALTPDGHLLAGAGTSLLLLSATPGTQPLLIDSTPTFGEPVALAADSAFAYALGETNGLELFSLREPTTLSRVAIWEQADRQWRDLAVAGSYAYLAESWVNGLGGGLRILDLTTPTRPVSIAFLPLADETNAVAVEGGVAFVAFGLELAAIDVTVPAAPVLLGSYTADRQLRRIAHLATGGDHAYLGGYYHASTCEVIDVSNPSSMFRVSAIDLSSYPLAIVLYDTLLAVATSSTDMLFDVSTPKTPREVGRVLIDPGTPADVALALTDSTLYGAAESAGLRNTALTGLDYRPRELDALRLFGGRGRGICARDSILFCAQGDSGLSVVDARSPRELQLLGGLATAHTSVGVTASDHYAYLAEESGGLRVVDVADPTAPVEVARLLLANGDVLAEAVAVEAGRIYVATADSGLWIVDGTTPEAPQLLGVAHFEGDGQAVTVRDDLAYVAVGYAGLRIIDVGDPQAAEVVGSIYDDDYTSVWDLALNWPLLYLATGGVAVVDVSDPANPEEVGWGRNASGGSSALTLSSSGYLYTTDYVWPVTVGVFDLSRPLHPREVFRYQGTRAWGAHLAAAGSTVFVQHNWHEISSIDARVAPLAVDGQWATGDQVRDVVVAHDYTYAATGRDGLRILDCTTPAAPVEVGHYALNDSLLAGEEAYALAVIDTAAYLALTYGGLRTLDIADPSTPVATSTLDFGAQVFDLAQALPYLCVASEAGLALVDVSTPLAPEWIGNAELTGHARHVAVHDGFAYVATLDALSVVTLADPYAPLEVATYGRAGDDIYSVETAGHWAFVGLDSHADGPSLWVLDISTPEQAVELGRWATSGPPFGIAFKADRLYLAEAMSGLELYDIGVDPPRRRGFFRAPGEAVAVALDEQGVIYLADRSGGLYLLAENPPRED